MSPTKPPPVDRETIIDLYFMEHRAKLIDIAAFLDRIDRAKDDASGKLDFRLKAFNDAVQILTDGRPQREHSACALCRESPGRAISSRGRGGADGKVDMARGRDRLETRLRLAFRPAARAPAAVPIAARLVESALARRILIRSSPTAIQKKRPRSGPFYVWRRERDSNPRWAFDPYSLSRGAPSASRPPLRIGRINYNAIA